MNLREKYQIPSNTVITIAGTVGVGKSTMTKALAEALHFRTSFEKVDTNPYLDKFYDDFEKHGDLVCAQPVYLFPGADHSGVNAKRAKRELL